MKPWLKITLAASIVLLVTLLAVLVHRSSLGQRLELWTYDLRFFIRGELPIASRVPIIILAIDEETYDEIEQPIIEWQPYFAEVINSLAGAGVEVIGIDILFDELTSIYPTDQQELAASILTAQGAGVDIILGFKMRGDEVEPLPPMLQLAAGDGLAYVNLTTDDDDFVRRQEMFNINPDDPEGPPVDGFALAVTRAYLDDNELLFEGLPAKPNTLLINFYSLEPYEKLISFYQLKDVAYRVKEAAERGESPATEDREFLSQFEGTIVLIGVIGGEVDLHATPLYFWVDRAETRQAKRTPGVLIHASTIATLLEQRFIRPLTETASWMVILLVVALGTLLSFRLPPVTGSLASLGLTLGYLVFAVVLFSGGYWYPVVAPVLGLFLAVSTSQVVNYFFEGREKSQLRGLFKRYVADQVIEQILAEPHLSLKGERKQISVLFSDIRNFTSRSESMDPEKLVELLNRYLEVMVEQIHRNRGTVDKFMGDGIMAIFGAPLEDPDCAYNATQAALDMHQALKGLNRTLASNGEESIRIGVGIHTGEAIVGNIGSTERLEYTAIGDVVNTASRLEALNKTYGSSILISSETCKNLNGRIHASHIADAALKGKSEAIAVYQVIPPENDLLERADFSPQQG